MLVWKAIYVINISTDSQIKISMKSFLIIKSKIRGYNFNDLVNLICDKCKSLLFIKRDIGASYHEPYSFT